MLGHEASGKCILTMSIAQPTNSMQLPARRAAADAERVWQAWRRLSGASDPDRASRGAECLEKSKGVTPW
jgi:hypothetical protein